MYQEALDGYDTPAKVCTHVDGDVARAPPHELGLGVDPALCLCVYFDGCSKVKQKLGAGGYLVYQPDGTLLAAAANYYRHEGPTNNVSEARALVYCITALDKVCWEYATRLVATERNHSRCSCGCIYRHICAYIQQNQF